MRFFRVHILFLVLFVASCSSPAAKYGYEAISLMKTAVDVFVPGDRFGTEAKKSAQKDYLKRLSYDEYVTQKDSWDAKLKTRKQQFNDTLKREYLELSQKLAKENNHTDSTYFRRKAIDAENGDFDIFPEDPTFWVVADDVEMEDLRAARLKLIDSLIGFTPVANPLDASRAIVSYDCWVQQAQAKSLKLKQDNCKQQFQREYSKLAATAKDLENRSLVEISEKYKWVDIDKTVYDKMLKRDKPKSNELYKVEYTSPEISSMKKDAVKTSAKQIGNVSAKGAVKASQAYTPVSGKAAPAAVQQDGAKVSPATAAPTAAKTAAATQVTAKAAEDKSLIADQTDSKTKELVYISYFDNKSDQLSDKGKAELDKAVEEIKRNNPKLISINGHTDRSFDSGASLITSKKRADAARDYLVSKGIAKEIMRTYGFGKTDNIVDNPEGQEVPANNRAEVSFKSAAE